MQRNNAARALRSDYARSWQDAASRVLEQGDGESGPLLPRRSTDSAPGTQSSVERSFFERSFMLGTGVALRKVVEDAQSSGASHKTALFWAPKSDFIALKNLLFGSWLNILLLLCPVGIYAHHAAWNPTAIFILNFIGIIPLALILGDVTEDLALRCGDVVGGLVNATFGNVVELIISCVALTKGSKELNDVAGLSNLGSVLSNLLLVLGCCFLFGGLSNKVQTFNSVSNQVSNSLLFLAVIALILPSAAAQLPTNFTNANMLRFSRTIAVLLLIVYVAYLYFQLVSHNDLFVAEGVSDDEGEAEEEPALTVTAEVLSLLTISLIVAAASELITGSIEGMAEGSGLPTSFLSVVLLPLAGNAVEHITAVMVAMKNKMDLALAIAIGSSIQIAIFVLPTCVIFAWSIGNPFSLHLDDLGTIALAVAIIHANFITSGGKSHYLMGLQLICTYLIISAVFLF
eukprot:jgi/Ulvmu1/5388/UM022_0183.1